MVDGVYSRLSFSTKKHTGAILQNLLTVGLNQPQIIVTAMEAKRTTTKTRSYSTNTPQLESILLSIEEEGVEVSNPVLPYPIKEVKRFFYNADELGSKSFVRALAQFLKEAIHIAAATKTTLSISTFKAFEADSSLPLLHLLKASGLPFKFLDFIEFDSRALDITIKILERRRENKREFQSLEAQQRAKAPAHHLQNTKTKEKSVARKIHYAWLDRNNMAAMNYIKKLANSNYTLKDIAEALTGQGIFTSKGKAHTPKSVSRLRERISELPNLIREIIPFDRPVLHVLGDIKVFSVRLSAEIPDFTDKIILPFSETIEQKVKVEIFNAGSQPHIPAFMKEYSPPFDSIVIDIREETVLIPGLHYIRLKANDYEPLLIKITLFAELFEGIPK